MSDLASSSSPIKLPLDPVNPMEAATQQYVDAADALKVNKAGDTLTGPLILDRDPVFDEEAANKHYVDTRNSNVAGNITSSPVGNVQAINVQAAIAELDTEKLPIAGGEMIGALVVADRVYTQNEAVPKKYVDKQGSIEFVYPNPAYTWNIVHTLNRRPSVTVLDTSGNQVIADVRFDLNDVNLVTVGFGTHSFTGRAILS